MLKCRWKLHEIQDDFTVKSLADALNISEVLARMLVIRDIKSFLDAKAFFRPSIDSLNENEKICIYGDYDVDGTCSTALLYLFLKELGANVDFYIPKRLTEGYGLSKNGVEFVKSKGASLLISVDCGITAIEETQLATELSMDVIICDHHQPKE